MTFFVEMVKANVWRIVKEFDGTPRDGDLEMMEEEIPALKDNEMLVEALYLTVDPYMRVQAETGCKVGDVMLGEQVGKVIESQNKDFPVGTFVRSLSGWRSRTVLKAKDTRRMPELGDLPLSTALGVMGMPGMTAYFGFLEICKPKEGEVVVVSGAAGAVGSLVGQIAKIKGCKVIGLAGSDEKCKWLKELGFGHAFNYKTTNLNEALKETASDGVDCYFDNVGGETSLTILNHLRRYGRMSICGQIALYNKRNNFQGDDPFLKILSKQLLVQGFMTTRWYSDWEQGEKEMAKWIQEGEIKYRETITNGFDNMFKAFQGLFTGSNTGKAIIKC